MEQSNLGKRISELRKAKGLTQEELAEQCKISTRTLQRIESGVVTPRAYTVRVIYAALKEDSSFKNLHFEYVKDLFNLKKNTMKKVSILAVVVLATGFGLFTLGPQSNAQASNKNKYVEDNSRNIIWLLPKGLPGYGTYFKNDTLFLRVGKDLIKESNRNVYLNDLFVGCADECDTVFFTKATLFKKAKLVFKRVEYQEIQGYGGAIFIFPKYPLRMANNDKMYYWIGNYEVAEKDNKIYLNGVYQGEAFARDTIILRPRGTLSIKTANKRE